MKQAPSRAGIARSRVPALPSIAGGGARRGKPHVLHRRPRQALRMRSQPLQKSEVKVFFLEGQDTEVLGGGRECVSRGINCASLDLLSNEESNGALTEIGQIRPGSSFGLGCETGCQGISVDACVEFERFKMTPEDGGAPRSIGKPHLDNLIEAAWPSQGRVNRFRSVGGSQDEHGFPGLQSVQKREQLSDKGLVPGKTLQAVMDRSVDNIRIMYGGSRYYAGHLTVSL